jgi:hypothetical protein
VAISVMIVAPACDKVPLLAPGGTVISLFPASSIIPLNGETEILATAIENGTASTPSTPPAGGGTTPTAPTTNPAAGTPVQNGTVITFTTTLGRIEPAEARTQNGQVRVRFIAGGQSGLANITAFSGGASTRLDGTNALKIGTAAAERVLLSASPQTLGPSGGNSEISARVEDISGAGVPGIPVTFTADVGALSASTSNTDSTGVARVTLTSQRQTVVTANVAGKTATVTVALNPRTGLTLTAPTTSLSALQPALFTVAVNAQANIRDVRIAWGDGSSQSLGALSASTTVSHIYAEAGTFTVSATATDASNFSESVSTTVIVTPAQPPSVIVTAAPASASVNQIVILRAQVSGNTSAILSYEWNFGVGATPPSATTSGNQVAVSWITTGSKFISVRVTQVSGPTGDGFGTVTIIP